jgi:hypothetical protein
MSEFYVVTNSNAAPFVSDTSAKFVGAETPKEALDITVENYSHPCGLYAAAVWLDANSKVKGEEPLLKWLSEKAIKDIKRR